MNLPKLESLNIKDKRVLVRADLDFDPNDIDNLRFKALVPTLDFINDNGGKIVLIGHRGRPEGKIDQKLSLAPFKSVFEKWNVTLLENLRFDPREETNDSEFAKELASKGDVYVNESFAASHRAHASIIGLPKLMPHAAGLRFLEEIDNLSKVFLDSKKPVVFVISGVKDDKVRYIEDFKTKADMILLGGRLPDYVHDTSAWRRDPGIIVANLLPDKEDITIRSIEKFEIEIKKAATVVLSGPVGKFEEEGHRQGTNRVFNAVGASSAFKVAGGGDTISAINLLKLQDKFDWISVGGGAMLEFLAKGTLPGTEALVG